MKILNCISDVNTKNYIIQPILRNHEYSKNIYDGCLNTIRVLTCVSGEVVKVVASVHRFGSATTGSVDNFSAGGISAKVDLKTGELLSAVQFDGKNRVGLTEHPDTGATIVGVKVPNWENAIAHLISLHSQISFVPYIGWDIAMVDDSFMIVEANHVSDLDLIQCHGGIIGDSDIKEFYKRKIVL